MQPSIYRIVLAVLLLSGVLASAGMGARELRAACATAQWQADKDKGALTVEGRDVQDGFLHAQRQWPQGLATGGSLDPAGDRACLPAGGSISTGDGWPKSRLKRHLHALLDHYEYPQRLSLFPKHGFW